MITLKPASLVPRPGDKTITIYMDDYRNTEEFLQNHKNYVVIEKNRPKRYKKNGHHSVHKHHPAVKTKKKHPSAHTYPQHSKPGDPLFHSPLDQDEDDLEDINSSRDIENDSDGDKDDLQFLFHEEHTELNSPETHLFNTNNKPGAVVYKGSTIPFIASNSTITNISVDSKSYVAQTDAADGTLSFKASVLFDSDEDINEYDIIVTHRPPVAAVNQSLVAATTERSKTWTLNDSTSSLGSGSYQFTSTTGQRGNIVTNQDFNIRGLSVTFDLDLAPSPDDADGFNVALVQGVNDIGTGGTGGYNSLGNQVALLGDTGYHMTGVGARTWINNDILYYNHSSVDETINLDQRLTGISLVGLYSYRVTFFVPATGILSAHFEKLTGDPIDIYYSFTGAFTDLRRHVEIGASTGTSGGAQTVSNVHIYAYS